MKDNFTISKCFTLLQKLSRWLIKLYKTHISRDEYAVEVKRWFDDKGDQTLRFDYPQLDQNSIVFDVGGYNGDFAYTINHLTDCKVFVFEPHPIFFRACEVRFRDNDKVVPLNYGLSDRNDVLFLSDSVDGSSFFNPNHKDTVGFECQIKEFFSVLDQLDVSKIHLMKINIEGGEFPLLAHMAACDRLDQVDQYQIQFHNFVENATALRAKIIDQLELTHVRTWCYRFVWENWKKIELHRDEKVL